MATRRSVKVKLVRLVFLAFQADFAQRNLMASSEFVGTKINFKYLKGNRLKFPYSETLQRSRDANEQASYFLGTCAVLLDRLYAKSTATILVE